MVIEDFKIKQFQVSPVKSGLTSLHEAIGKLMKDTQIKDLGIITIVETLLELSIQFGVTLQRVTTIQSYVSHYLSRPNPIHLIQALIRWYKVVDGAKRE